MEAQQLWGDETETAPLACGCTPYTQVRCDEGTRLMNEHAAALNAKRDAFNAWARQPTPEAQDALRAAGLRVDRAREAIQAHIGEAV